PVDGAYGIVWPQGAALAKLSASRQPLPSTSSPLEAGDDLYAAGRYLEAHAEFQRQADLSDGPGSREAQCKAALCLAAMGRHEEAADILIALASAADTEDRWSLVALYQLW